VKKYFSYIFIVVCFYTAPLSATKENPSTNLPLPRFASLKADEVNVRKGPSVDYPIIWTYKKQNYPIKIIAEYKHWRKIEDHYHHIGWVHKTLLSGKKTAMILHPKQKTIPIFQKPRNSSTIIGYVRPYAIGNIIKCNQNWCVIKFNSFSGWINKNFIWGILK